MHALSKDLLHWSLLFCLYSIALNCLILSQISLVAVHFFTCQLTLFLTHHSASSLLRSLRLSTSHPNAGDECSGHTKSFLGRGRFWNVFGYCTEEGRSETTAVSGWLGGQAHLPLHQPCIAWKHRAWLSFLMLSGALGGKEEALQFPISLECQHGQGSPAITHLFTDSQKVCFLREIFWFWEKSVHVMQQLLSSEGTTL